MKTTSDDTFLALDIATTGLDPENDGIVELAIIRFNCAGDVFSALDTLLDPGIPISAEEGAVHHITDGMVAGKPSPLDIWDYILEKLSSSLFVVHNAPRDVTFLKNLHSSHPNMQEIRFIDTLEMHRDRYPGAGTHSLEHLTSKAGDPYRATTGAQSIAALFIKMMKDRKRKNIPDYYIQYAKDIREEELSQGSSGYIHKLNGNSRFAGAKQKAGNYVKRLLGRNGK